MSVFFLQIFLLWSASVQEIMSFIEKIKPIKQCIGLLYADADAAMSLQPYAMQKGVKKMENNNKFLHFVYINTHLLMLIFLFVSISMKCYWLISIQINNRSFWKLQWNSSRCDGEKGKVILSIGGEEGRKEGHIGRNDKKR
jgi:hypothetical protein